MSISSNFLELKVAIPTLSDITLIGTRSGENSVPSKPSCHITSWTTIPTMSDESVLAPTGQDKGMAADEAELARMGYKQELRRDLSVSFSIISVITGIPSLFLYGLNTGGPAVMVWGWVVVACFTMLVGLAMAGTNVIRKQNAPLASWITGWFNLLGQVALRLCQFYFHGCTLGNTGFVPTPKTTIGLTNTFGVHLLHYLNNISVWWHASAEFVSRRWGDRASHVYVVVIGYTLTGMISIDASAHRPQAAMSGSIGIVMAIGVSAVLGWFLILGLLFSIQDFDTTLGSTTGQPVTQIFLDTVGRKVIVIVSMYFCGTFSITSNSRMMYAFARDGGIPGHKFFAKVSPQWKSPIRTVWLACTLSFILGLPSLGSSVAFAAATSIATIGLYISYGIPIALRVVYRDQFVRGPFHLGAFSFPVAIAAVLWICFISIAFILPQINPVDSLTFNYSIVAVGIVILYSVGFWIVSARKWFSGPVKQIEAEGKGIDVMDPAEAEKFEKIISEKA
ncbi:APC amino acid permease [Pholiota molesta]|nr:APC amino acid permease [Pholiota molesta]